MPKQSFVVQTFKAKGKGIEPEEARAARDEGHALSLGARLSETKAGVVVLRQDGNPEAGDTDEPVVLAIHGRVPPIFQDLPF